MSADRADLTDQSTHELSLGKGEPPMTDYDSHSASVSPGLRARAALIAGIGLLAMAVLAPIAHFGVLQTLIVPADAAATVENLVASAGTFRLAIAALLIVALLDVVVAWALYALLRPVNPNLALLVGWLRLVYAAGFAIALARLVDVAQLVGDTGAELPIASPLTSQVMGSLASFDSGWGVSLAIFGLHLIGLGYLVFRSPDFPRFLGALVAVAGAGYLVDSFVAILLPDIDTVFSTFTFVGEALLIGWLLWRAVRGLPSASDEHASLREARLVEGSSLAL